MTDADIDVSSLELKSTLPDCYRGGEPNEAFPTGKAQELRLAIGDFDGARQSSPLLANMQVRALTTVRLARIAHLATAGARELPTGYPLTQGRVKFNGNQGG